MIGCLRTRDRKQPIIALYFEFENELKFYNLEALSLKMLTLCLGKKEFDLVNSFAGCQDNGNVVQSNSITITSKYDQIVVT